MWAGSRGRSGRRPRPRKGPPGRRRPRRARCRRRSGATGSPTHPRSRPLRGGRRGALRPGRAFTAWTIACADPSLNTGPRTRRLRGMSVTPAGKEAGGAAHARPGEDRGRCPHVRAPPAQEPRPIRVPQRAPVPRLPLVEALEVRVVLEVGLAGEESQVPGQLGEPHRGGRLGSGPPLRIERAPDEAVIPWIVEARERPGAVAQALEVRGPPAGPVARRIGWVEEHRPEAG